MKASLAIHGRPAAGRPAVGSEQELEWEPEREPDWETGCEPEWEPEWEPGWNLDG